jgi:RND family efflux transporter MFP subunit
MNWRILLFIPAVALGVALFWLQTRGGAEDTAQATEIAPVAVRVMTVAASDITVQVSGFGRVTPHRTWEAVSQVDGRITEMYDDLAEGVMVPEGATLLSIDPRDYEIARDRAAANLDTAQAQLAELEAQEENTAEQIALERRIEAVAQAEVDRREALVTSGTASAASLEQAQRDLITQQRRVLDLENQLALVPVQRVSVEATIRTRSVELEEAERHLSNVVITAPFQARVAVAEAEVGEYVRVGQSLLTINGTTAANITAEVQPDEMRSALRLLLANITEVDQGMLIDSGAARRAIALAGITATLRNTQNGQSAHWPAEIIRIDGSVDDTTGTIGIVVRVDNPGVADPSKGRPPLATGSFVEVLFSGTGQTPRISLPRSAVLEDVEGAYVYVVDDESRLARQYIGLEGRTGRDVVINDGLSDGMQVLLAVPQPAILGMALAPVDAQ